MKQRLLKFVFITVLGLLPALASAATDWTEDKMWADPVELMPGEETTFILHLENTQDNVAGVEVSFTLPEGVTVPTYYDEDMEEDVLAIKFVGREKGHDLASSFNSGLYKVLISSMKNNTLKNDKSDLLEITLKAADDAALGKYTIDFTGCLYATKTTDQYNIDDFEVDLSVYALIEAVNLSVNQLDVPYGKTISIPMPTYEPEALAEYIDLSIELSEGAEEYVELDLENNTITGLKVTEDAPAIGIIYTATNTTYAKDTKTISLNISVAPQLPEDIQIWAPTTNGGTWYLPRWSGQWLAADVYPYDAYNKDIEWTIVSGEDVVYLQDWGWDEETEDGEIIHHPVDWYVYARDVYGEAVVRATCVANPAVYAEFTVKVVESVDKIEITSGEEVMLTLEEDLNPDMPEYKTTAQLTVKITPEKFENQKVYWYIGDSSVATVSDEGLVTAVGYGETNVYAYTAWPSEENQNSTTWSDPVRIEVKKVPTCTVTTQIPADETITVEPEEEGKVNIKEQIDAVASDGSEVIYEVITGESYWDYDEENGYWYEVFVPNADYDPETGILTYKYDYSGEVTVKVYVPSESEDTFGSTPLYYTVFFNMAYPQTIYAPTEENIQYSGNNEYIYVYSDSGLPIGVELLEGNVDWGYYDWGSSVYVYYRALSCETIKFKFSQEGNYEWQPAEPVITTINVAKGDAVLEPWYNDGEIFQWNGIYFHNNNYETPVNVEILEGEDLISNSNLYSWAFEYYANEMGWLKLRISQEGNENWNAPEPVEISVYIGKAYQSVWTNWLPTTDFTVEENQLTPITFGSATSWMYDPELGYFNDEDIQWSYEVIDGNVQAQFITGEQVGVYEANEEDLQVVGYLENGEPVYQGIVYNGTEDNWEEANIFISPWSSYETIAFFQGTGTVGVTAYNPGNEYYYDYYNYWWLTFSDGTTGVKDVKVENVIKVEGRTITAGDGSQMLEVYNANGMTLYRGYDSTVTVPAAGIYIVRCGEKVSKIYVR